MKVSDVQATYERQGQQLALMGMHNRKVYQQRGISEPGHMCHDCGNEIDYFMLEEPVWTSLAPALHSKCLCLTCVEKHLERPLTIEDFSPAPINRGILKGFMMGVANVQA